MPQAANSLSGAFPDQGRSRTVVRQADDSEFVIFGSHFTKTSPRSASLYSGARLDRLDTFVFLPCMWIACALGFAIGDYPLLFSIMPPLCLVYAIVRGITPPRLLATYVTLCLIGGVLSWGHAFPRSWQLVFLADAIPRQLIPIISFFIIAWAAKAYFLRRIQAQDIFARGGVFIALSYFVAPIIMFVNDVHYEGDDTASTILAAYGSFINNIALASFFIFGHLFCSRGARRHACLVVILLIAATSHFIQFKLVALAAILMLIGFPPRSMIMAVIAVFVASYAIQACDIPGAVARNPDKGIRVAFIADAFQSLIDTSGLGIGYGTESVRWVYRFPGMPDFTFMPDPTTISKARLMEVLSRGVHNSFAQAMLRLGLVGLLLLTFAMFRALPPRGLPKPVQCHASMAFIVIFVACFVNPALESPRQLIGVGFAYGYLLALRSCAKPRPGNGPLRLAHPGDSRSIMMTEVV